MNRVQNSNSEYGLQIAYILGHGTGAMMTSNANFFDHNFNNGLGAA